MESLRKLGSFVADFARRLGSLIVTRFDLVEVRILTIGLALAGLLGAWLAYLVVADSRLYATLSSTVILHLVGGRGLGVVTCLSAGLSAWFTVVYNFYLEVVIVLIAYGVVVLIMRNLIQPKLLKSTVRQAELAAQRQRTRVKRYGAIGLFVFVMFPFMMTGPVAGAIIGYLLNYRPRANFSIVFSGTLASIVIYTVAGDRLLALMGRYVDLEAVQTWGSVIVGVLILVFAIYHVGTVKRFLDSHTDD
jgi:uncharacterized membrane protein